MKHINISHLITKHKNIHNLSVYNIELLDDIITFESNIDSYDIMLSCAQIYDMIQSIMKQHNIESFHVTNKIVNISNDILTILTTIEIY